MDPDFLWDAELRVGASRKKPRRSGVQEKPETIGESGSGLDVGCLCALRALGQLVADALAFLQAAEALAVDRGVVGKDIGAAIFRRDESEALGVIEPFHGTVRHSSGISLLDAGGGGLCASAPAEYANTGPR